MSEKKRRYSMLEKEKLITVSVRLCEAEYKALQSAAREECTTMSGVLRRLLNRHFERMNHNG
ncbi:MAG: hypothetical protein IJ418_17625 [Clostridia bacterium]|nr:hypothetical protein [Clostridia bacterium]